MRNGLNGIADDLERLGDILRQNGDPSLVISPLVRIVCQLRQIESRNASDKDDFMDQIDRIIDKSISSSELSVDAIAKEMLLSRSLLYKRFAEHKKCSLGMYVTEKRILAAKTLLCNPKISILEVADAVGFSDQRYFSTYFKKHTGMTPTQWRQRIDSQNNI